MRIKCRPHNKAGQYVVYFRNATKCQYEVEIHVRDEFHASEISIDLHVAPSPAALADYCRKCRKVDQPRQFHEKGAGPSCVGNR